MFLLLTIRWRPPCGTGWPVRTLQFTTMQAILVDFFWDSLHWVQQSVVYLPKDEGGQGLIHLQTRYAAFRLQFLQRPFDGASDFS